MDTVRLFVLIVLSASPLALVWAAGQDVRLPAVAGSWYEGTREKLAQQVDGFLAKVPEREAPGRLVGLISPHAGVVYSGQTAAYGYKLLRGTKVNRIILLGPSHAGLPGATVAVAKAFQTPLGDVPLDRQACDKLVKDGVVKPDPTNEGREHSLEIQLPFLQRTLEEFSLVPIMIGPLRRGAPERLAEAIRPLLDEHTVIVASSDFTHYGRAYGYVPFTKDVPESLRKLDGGAVAHILKLDADGFRQYVRDTGATICGALPIEVLLRCLPAKTKGEQLHYGRSADRSGDFSMSVSYVSAAFFQE